jgi:hypothetical protein
MSEPNRNSRMRTLAALALAFALSGAAAHARAQEAEHLRRKADSIMGVFRNAEAIIRKRREADSIQLYADAHAGPGQQLIKLSGVTIVADTALSRMAEHSAREAVQAVEQLYGQRVNTRVRNEQWYLTLLWKRDDSAHKRKREVVFIFRDFGERGISMREAGRTSPSELDDVSRIFRRRLDDLMLRSMDSAAQRWTMRMLGAGEDASYLFEPLYRELAIGPSPHAKPCLAGNLSSCAEALSIRHDPVPEMHQLSSSARAGLLRLALEDGGAESFSRFMSDTTLSMEKRLEAAFGGSIDALLDKWLARVIDARPEPARPLPQTALAAIVWTSLLCGISLRSSRWR